MTRMRIDDQDIAQADIFEILLDHFPDMIHSIDDNGAIVYANRTAEKLLGYTVEELLRMNIRQIYAEEVLEAVEAGFRDLKARGDKTVESLFQTKSGEKIPVEIRSFGIYNDDGRFIRTFSISRDLRKIKELQQSLIHASRLAAIGELAASIAHDINNPLTVVLLSTEMTLNTLSRCDGSPPDTEMLLGFAHNCHKAAKAIQKLSEHLRNFSRGMAEKPERIDLHETVNDALFMTQNKIAKAGVTVENRIPQGTHFVWGAPNQLEQVFVNLIGNACDAMEGRSERRLTLSVAPTTLQQVAAWQCDVIDTGTGIPETLRDEVFRSFFTTKPKGKGTGLGLSICRGIIAEHKGELRLASEVGKGTTFSVCLPVAPSANAPPPSAG